MSNEKMRMDFEVWECAADEGPQTDPAWLMFDEKTNTFPMDKIQERWRVWQASRAAIEVELPVAHSAPRNSTSYQEGLADGFERAIYRAEEAIQSLGLKVKS